MVLSGDLVGIDGGGDYCETEPVESNIYCTDAHTEAAYSYSKKGAIFLFEHGTIK